MYIIYNAGYKLNINIKGLSGKSYIFKKSFVTRVNDKKDIEYFLSMTSKDIAWCPSDPRHIPPFMKLEDWCLHQSNKIDPQEYLEIFLLEN